MRAVFLMRMQCSEVCVRAAMLLGFSRNMSNTAVGKREGTGWEGAAWTLVSTVSSLFFKRKIGVWYEEKHSNCTML